ncbi:MAG: thioredoxin-disulfide reductase [Candidatus Micrarchaeia archaeon]
MEIENVIIIGSGPAGLTAAIYAARAELKPIVISGMQPGGQISQTTLVENYPGFPDGIMGPELMDNMRKQAEKFGTRFIDEEVVSVDFRNRPFTIKTETKELKSKAVIIASGATAKWLGVPGESKLIGKGVSGCATCDGFFFKGKDVAVIGGGDTALEDAIFLTKFANSVTIIHRRDQLRASKIMQERAFANQKIKFIWDTVVTEIIGEEKVTGIRIKNVKTGEEKEMKIDGVFVAIGHSPATNLFKGQIEIDENGYIIKKENTETSVKGVFVAGDVADKRYKQAIAAAGDGCKAAIDVEKYLQEKD